LRPIFVPTRLVLAWLEQLALPWRLKIARQCSRACRQYALACTRWRS